MTLKEVISSVEEQGFEIDKRPFKLNIVGIRNLADTMPDEFQDEIAYFYFDNNGKPVGRVARGTTSPSTYFLKNPMNLSGTAILKQGQYKDAYGIGLHRGKYSALVQVKPVTVIRDTDRNSYLDFFADTQTGLFGINIHRATRGKNNEAVIGQDSAGCQVYMYENDFSSMMSMANKSRDMYGNRFTYTLIDKRTQVKKRINYALVGGILIAMTLYVYYLKKKKVF
jgi:hypothetical protein